MYPECDDHILIYPELANYSVSGLPTAFSVNWTPVHALSWVYEAPHNLHVNMPTLANTTPQVMKPPISRLYGSLTSSTIFRVWIETPLQEWLTIWKQIIFPSLYVYSWYNGTYYSTLQVKVWLLHTDWTITYVATNDYSSKVYFSYSYNVSSTRQPTENYTEGYKYLWAVITWSWITTVEWDRIIVEYIVANNSSTTASLILWTQTPITDQEKIYPIQISID